jgi:hypothetical protein
MTTVVLAGPGPGASRAGRALDITLPGAETGGRIAVVDGRVPAGTARAAAAHSPGVR